MAKRFRAIGRTTFLTAAILGWAVSSPAVTTVACIGNSITEGSARAYAKVGITIRDGGYPLVLQEKLGSSFRVINYGLGGRWVTHTDSLSRSVYENNIRCAELLSTKPDIVFFMMGTNDCQKTVWNAFGHRFARDYEAFATKVKNLNPSGRFIVCRILPVFDTTYGFQPHVNRDSIVPKIDLLCSLHRWETVDTRTPFMGMAANFKDGVHPDQKGLDLLAAAVYGSVMHPPSSAVAVGPAVMERTPGRGVVSVALPLTPGVQWINPLGQVGSTLEKARRAAGAIRFAR